MNKKETIFKSDFILSLGTMFFNKEELKNLIIESIEKTDTKFVYMHPIDNTVLKPFCTQFIKYEAGSEEGILALILKSFVKETTDKIQKFINDLDLGYISAESSAGEEEFEEAYENSKKSQFKTLIIGEDLIEHPRVKNIVKLLNIIKKYTDFNLVVLDSDFEERINSCEDFDLEEIAELKSFDGTVVYRVIEDKQNKNLITSKSFAQIAKIENNDEVFLNYKSTKIKTTIKIDEKLHGTIAIINTRDSNEEIFNNYRYKQVKIEKVDA